MDADDLFGLPLDQFIAERTALARSLRSEGRREEAKEVAATRKPSVAAWAVNQLVRTQGRAMDELLEAGDALRAAQDQVLAGKGDRQGLRSAAERERGAVEDLVKAAGGLLTSEGHELGSAIIERVSDTLHAAALNEEARRQVKAGTLQRELRHVGFGVGDVAPGPPSERQSRAPTERAAGPSKKTKAKNKDNAKDKDKAQAGSDRAQRREHDREERRRAERERAAALKAARTAEGEARRAAQRATRALELTQERRDRAAHALADAEEELERARTEAEAVAEAHRAATAELKQLSGPDGG
jgi:hypothetical protein